MAYCPECAASLPAAATSCPTCGAALLDTPTLVEHDAAPSLRPDPEQLKSELAAALEPRYELLRPLGEGGMGMVFLAREPALKRLVAVKLLAPDLAGDHAARARFEREARAAAALSHPNVVRVYAVGETAALTLPYIIMQYVEGSTLAELMAERGRLGERDARRIIGEVAAALSAAHGRDLVHRDVKPSNVLVERDTSRAYVADFGVSAAFSPGARAEQTKLTATGMMVGTPVYMSPEQASAGEVGPASDVYSLGVMGYELLTGEPPFTATTAMGWAAAHLRDTPTPVAVKRTDVAPEVALLVDRCLAKEPAKRPTAGDVARGMMPSLESELPWPPPGLHPLFGRGRSLARLSMLSGGAGIALVMLLTFPPGRLFARGAWLQPHLNRLDAAGPFAEVDRMVTQQVDAALITWQAALALATVVGVVAYMGLAAALQRTVGLALRARVAGWRWTTVGDVVADSDGRAGLVLSGGREFAPLSEATRASILSCRRWAVGAQVGGAVWLAGVMALSLAAAVLAGASTEAVAPVMSGWTAALATLPAFTGFIVAAAARILERSLLGALARRRVFVPDAAEVAGWYALASRGAPQPLKRTTGTAVRAAMGIAATVAALLVVATVALAAAAAVVAARNTRWIGPQAASMLQLVDRYQRSDPHRRKALLLRPYLPSPLEPAADTAARELYRSLTWRSGLPQYPDHAKWQRMVRAQYPVQGGEGAGDLLRRAYEGRLGRDTLQAMAAIASHVRTVAFRRLAHVDRLDVLTAAADRPLAAYPSIDAIPSPGWEDFQFAAEANVMASLADLARRDVDGAARRLGENARIALLFWDTPTPWAQWTARNVERFAFRPLADLERLRGNRLRADSLREAAGAREGFPMASPALAADVRDVSRLRALLADGRLPVSARFNLVQSSWYGLCLNPREIAFGPSRARRDTLAGLVRDIPDLAHAAELADLLARGWGRSEEASALGGMPARARGCGIYFRYFWAG